MKKFSSVLVLLLMALLLVGCSNLKEGYADKVNEAVAAGEPLTYEQVIKDLGEATEGEVYPEGQYATGTLIWVKGCKSYEEALEKAEDGKTVYTLTIVFTAGYAVGAHWLEIGEDAPE